MRIRKYFLTIIVICIGLGILGVVFLDHHNSVRAYRDAKQIYFSPNMNTAFERYLEERNNNSDKWLTFTGILSTLLAVFFVYTGFKIDSTKEKVDETEKRILETERKINEDIYEYARQLEYAMSFIIQKQYGKAIDALRVL